MKAGVRSDPEVGATLATLGSDLQMPRFQFPFDNATARFLGANRRLQNFVRNRVPVGMKTGVRSDPEVGVGHVDGRLATRYGAAFDEIFAL